MYNKDSIYYAEKINVLGTLGKVDFIKDVVTLVDDDSNLHEVAMNEIQELKSLGVLDSGVFIYEHDVLVKDGTDKCYEILLNDNGSLQLSQLNDSYEPIGYKGEPFHKDNVETMKASLVGNVFQLRKSVPKVEFNLAIFRKHTTDDVVYFYAGNDKVKGTVDLIKVIYIGSTILEEEEYQRLTFTHKEFLQLVKEGKLKEVNPNELANYVMGKTYETPVSAKKAPKCDCYRNNGTCNGECYFEDLTDFDFDDFDEEEVDEDKLW